MGLAELLDLSLLVHLVGLLVVDEQVGGALATDPSLQDLLVRLLLKGLLYREKFSKLDASVTVGGDHTSATSFGGRPKVSVTEN